MTMLEEFQSVLQRGGARLVGQRYYGVWEEFPFSAHVDRSKEPGTVSFVFRMSASLEKGLLKTLNKSFPKGCRLMEAPGSCYQLLCSGGPMNKNDSSLYSVLNLLTRSLRDAGISPNDVCPICHCSGCDAYADVHGYSAVHRACVETMTEKSKAEAEKAVRSGNYFTGLIGALLGGLVACIPTIIVYFMGYLVGYLYALIPLGAYYGYKLFRGRMNSGAFICTCIASVIHLFSIEQIIFYIMVVQEWGLWLSVIDSVKLYWSFMTLGDAFRDMLMSIIFMCLGLWISWGQIRRTAYTDMGAANTVRSTLVDQMSSPF